MFIVHASTDKSQARRLLTALEQLEVSCFLDQRDVTPGRPWGAQIKRTLRESLVQVVLIGKHERWYQHEEIAAAIKRMRALGTDDRVVPVLLESRDSLPYGLEQLQAIVWDGPEPVATKLAVKIAALRGAALDNGKLTARGSRVRVGVVGFWRQMPDALTALEERVAQRTAMLDGAVRRIDLEGDASLDLDLRIVLLGDRHHGRLDRLAALIEASTAEAPDTIVGALAINIGKVPKDHRSEALEVQELHDRLEVVWGTAAETVDALHDRIVQWYAARFPTRPGRSVTRERWEDRYLQDKAPLWRKGDPNAMRLAAGARAERVQWYVHLKAARPWSAVAGELRCEVEESVLAVPAAQAPPKELWWVRADDDISMQHPLYGLDGGAFRNCDQDRTAPWLDTVLSHELMPRCVVIGQAGTGKTVLLQHLAWALTTGAPGSPDEPAHNLDLEGLHGGSPIPPIPILHTATTVVSHLRRSGGSRPIREALVELLRSSDTFGDAADAATLRAGIDCGRYLFLIDSLDEIPRRDDRQLLVDALGALEGQVPRVILTTRPSSHTKVELPQGFQRVDIATLDDETIDRLVVAWVQTWAPGEDIESIRDAVAKVKRVFPTRIDESSPVENPLLLSCILQVYATYRRLPDDTAKLYSDMVRVLCEAKIRVADDQQRDSLVERYREALRELFLESQELGGTRLRIKAAEDLLVDKKFASRASVENWLQGLANHTGLLTFEGHGDSAMMRPWHRSFQEFLAAEAIALRFANQPTAYIAWLREPRKDQGMRLVDGGWQGTLRFLIGAAVHQNRAWGVGLVEALVNAATEGDDNAGYYWAIALLGAAEYSDSFFANEDLIWEIPRKFLAAFQTSGDQWSLAHRLDALDAVGRLGDPRLPDPRTVTSFDVSSGWIFVAPLSWSTSGGQLRQAVQNVGKFWIRRWPVTVAEFRAFIEESRARSPDSWRDQVRHPNRPVVDVDWYTARRFCHWAQRRWSLPGEGRLDLPTSAEWVVAACGGTDRAPREAASPAMEHVRPSYRRELLELDRSGSGATPVGAFPFGNTPDGLWDMTGNISEWCASLHRDLEEIDLAIAREYHDTRVVDPVVHRGGKWQLGLATPRIDQRGHKRPSEHDPSIGFRVVCRPPTSAVENPMTTDRPTWSDFDDEPTPVGR